MRQAISTYNAMHNVCVVIWRVSPVTAIIEFLVVSSRSTHPRTRVKSAWRLKFPGGRQEGPNEPKEGTRDREIWQEVSLAFRRSKLIWEFQPNFGHTQYGYLVDVLDCSGQIRTVPTVEQGDGEELGVPVWKQAKTLHHSIFHKHQSLCLAACRELGLY